MIFKKKTPQSGWALTPWRPWESNQVGPRWDFTTYDEFPLRSQKCILIDISHPHCQYCVQECADNDDMQTLALLLKTDIFSLRVALRLTSHCRDFYLGIRLYATPIVTPIYWVLRWDETVTVLWVSLLAHLAISFKMFSRDLEVLVEPADRAKSRFFYPGGYWTKSQTMNQFCYELAHATESVQSVSC